MTPKLITYKHYKITVRTDGVAVFDPRFPRAPALFRAATLDEAKRWVTGYRDGAMWAVDAKLSQAQPSAEYAPGARCSELDDHPFSGAISAGDY
jgi:hypothetical protein